MALVLQTVLEQGPVSKAQIARLTGLSKSSVATLVRAVNDLRTQPLIVERAVLRGGVGRPATELALDPLAASVLGVVVYVDHVDLVYLSLAAQVIGRESLAWSRERSLIQTLKHVLSDNTTGCIAIGVACPGLVDVETGRVDLALELNWHRLELGPDIHREVGLPTIVMNRSLASVYGEFHTTGMANLIHLTVGTDVGAGLVVRGKPVTGHRHQAGELGHTTVRTVGGHVCRCGQKGCLEAEVSCDSVRDRLHEAGFNSTITCGYEALSVAEQACPAQAAAVRHQVMCDLAAGLTISIRLLDPEAILLDGHLALLGPGVVSELSALLWERRLGNGNLPVIQFSEADPAMGAGLYALERLGSDVLIYGHPRREPTVPAGNVDANTPKRGAPHSNVRRYSARHKNGSSAVLAQR